MPEIPEIALRSLAMAPADRQVSLLMRHAHRYPIVDIESTYTTPLTPEGVRLAEDFGARLNQVYRPGRLLASPVGRCLATGEAIARGAAWNVTVQADNRLSHPHIQPAISDFSGWSRGTPLPLPVQEVLDLILVGTHNQPALDLLITHDTIVACLVSYLLGAPVSNEYWPEYFEGLILWPEDGTLQAIWRGQGYRLQNLAYQPGLFWRTT
jgi:hypothetical protein